MVGPAENRVICSGVRLSGAVTIGILVFAVKPRPHNRTRPCASSAKMARRFSTTRPTASLSFLAGQAGFAVPRRSATRISFDVRAMTADSRPEVMVRAAYARNRNDRLRGYRIALLPPARSKPSSWLIGSQRASRSWRNSRWCRSLSSSGSAWSCPPIGPKLTVAIDGTRVATYEVEELAGHLVFANPKGLAHMRDVQIDAVPFAVTDSSTLMDEDALKKAGGRPSRLVHEVKPSYTREAMRSMIQGKVLLTATVRRRIRCGRSHHTISRTRAGCDGCRRDTAVEVCARLSERRSLPWLSDSKCLSP